jgi:hypothetical protein
MPHLIGDVAEKVLKEFLMVKVADLNHEKSVMSSKGLALLLYPKGSSNSKKFFRTSRRKRRAVTALRLTTRGKPG